MVGKIISHYKILEKIGSGGMGIVYKAEDIKLKREVALKFLPADLTRDSEAKERFIHEAQAASSLEHSNICNIHEINETDDDQLYIVMAFYEGTTLKDKITKGIIDEKRAVDIVTQIAKGLSIAHQKGIIHRDIKPANILITEDNEVKILDFGLAKLASQTKLTKSGSTLGTVAYMSPEQARGDSIDYQTDIWSLGVVFYESLTGQLPFKGEYEQAMMYSILNDEPKNLEQLRSDISPSVKNLLRKSLNKNKADRYREICEIIYDLKTFSSSIITTPKEKSIVVLPFENLSSDPEQVYFSDGLTEEIITDLSQIRELIVISRSSAMRLKGTEKDIRTIGKELNVQYVLEGSVRKAGNNLRITAQLINAKEDIHIWADKYKGTLEDVFAIQEKVSQSIVDALKLKLSSDKIQQINESRFANVKVYDFYLRARHEIWRWTEDGLKRATKYLYDGLDIVSDNILLYTGLVYVIFQYEWVVPRLQSDKEYSEKLVEAEEFVNKIFKIDPESSHGYKLLGLIQYKRGNAQDVVYKLKHSLIKNPNDPDALFYLILTYGDVGKTTSAYPLTKRLLEIDPLTAPTLYLPGWLLWMEGKLVDAVIYFEKSYRLESDNILCRFAYAWILSINFQLEEAFIIFDEMLKSTPQAVFAQMGSLFKYAFQKEKKKVIDSMNQELITVIKRDELLPLQMAEILALIDERERSLDFLEVAINQGFINYPYLKEYDPLLKNVRSEARFIKLMDRLKYKWDNFVV